jgi:protein-tyrosine phosphatase
MDDWPWYSNFRDAGDGLLVPRGKIYRGALDCVTDPILAHRMRREVGVRTVLDLRTTIEVEESGGLLCGVDALEHHHVPLFETIRLEWHAPLDGTSDAAARRYRQMVDDGAKTLVRIVATLARAEAFPVLIHCAAGRDRTGIVVGFLLALLDTPHARIADDYSRSDEAAFEDGGTAHAATMTTLLEDVVQTHGSARAFLLAHGASAEMLDAFVLAARAPCRAERA